MVVVVVVVVVFYYRFDDHGDYCDGVSLGVGSNSPFATPTPTVIPNNINPIAITPLNPDANVDKPTTILRLTIAKRCTGYISEVT